MKVGKKTTLEDLAFLVSSELIKANIPATLSGGGAVWFRAFKGLTFFKEKRQIAKNSLTNGIRYGSAFWLLCLERSAEFEPSDSDMQRSRC